ncbi:MAG: PilZ domain-containing protein [Candidatus Pacebacteria bacterium]|nr:PilZ domain-containing protein [Candidatus Paceibacterota bacterium]
MDKEKRYSRRKVARNISVSLRPLDPKIWFRYWNAADGNIRDMSMAGIGIYSQQKIPIGSLLSVDLRLGETSATIRIFGRVQWVRKEEDCFRAGGSFSWWKDDQDKKTAGTYLERLSIVN